MAAKTTALKFRKVESGHHVLGDTGYSVRSRLAWVQNLRKHQTVWGVYRHDATRTGEDFGDHDVRVQTVNDLPAAKRAARALAAA